MFRSTGFRLAALFTLVFTACGVLLAIMLVLGARSALSHQFDNRIRTELDAMAQEYDTEGLSGVTQSVQEHERIPSAMFYGLETPDGRPIAGRLAGRARPEGWSLGAVQADGHSIEVRMLTSDLAGGERLIIGDDAERIEALDGVILRNIGWAIVLTAIIGAVGGLLLGRDLHARLSVMTQTAGAIAEGDLSRRTPVRGSHDDLDEMARAFNLMLDRIGELMDSLRHVTTDLAHDLRTPLSRLRQKLEAGMRGEPAAQGAAMEAALGDLDAILDTFAALLRIAQVESGARRAAFHALDLKDLAGQVTEAFAPSAEEAGQKLLLSAPAPARVLGDQELLTQMLVNLVENALRHAGEGARVGIDLTLEGRHALLSVTDNGPGIPPPERAKVFDRFYRLERSRTTPGSGLGLPLAAAIARLHGGEVRLEDAGPGLAARVSLPLE